MTQAELADRIGVTRRTGIAIEKGRYSPSLEMAFRIAHVFGVPFERVFQHPVGEPGSGSGGSEGEARESSRTRHLRLRRGAGAEGRPRARGGGRRGARTSTRGRRGRGRLASGV
ncbi:helix-turn-helix transcriptional regulator [Streptomyces marianii]|uniref:helix-turn-helix transcriptional regulator n=1 Tax=Streptomyces marianii TaxID=1817406 RepID=UPI001F19B935